MSRIDRAEIHAVTYEVEGLAPGGLTALGVGNMVRAPGGRLPVSRYSAETGQAMYMPPLTWIVWPVT